MPKLRLELVLKLSPHAAIHREGTHIKSSYFMAIVTVGSYSTEVEAQVAQAALDSNGVSSIILRDDAGGMLPSLHILANVKLAVQEEDAQLAREILGDPDE